MTTETIEGKVSRTFRVMHDRPWMAGVLQKEGGGELRFSGKIAAEEGDRLEITGAWVDDPQWGPQFKVESGQVRMDETPEALIQLLATSKEFRGLGPVRAEKVVDCAVALCAEIEGGELSAVLLSHAGEISEITGVNKTIIEDAGTTWSTRRNYYNALAALGAQGWSGAQSQRIVAEFGEGAPRMVEKNPYFLIGKLERFGFRTVDAVALQMGMENSGNERLSTGIAYCLGLIEDEGSTWTTRESLVAKVLHELRPDSLEAEDKVGGLIRVLIKAGEIHEDRSPLGAELLSDARMVRIEAKLFERLLDGLNDGSQRPLKLDGERSTVIVDSLNDGQRAAMAGFSQRRIGVVSGGAGTGKTYTMRAICEVAEENGIDVALCAPTGKASRRLAHSTGRPAQTIHKLLEPQPDHENGGFHFTRNEERRLPVGLVIVDEVSMISVTLAADLLKALGAGCRLLLVGDHHQIPSVGAGAVLRDMLAASHRYPEAVHVLTEIVRQAGILARNTTSILDGVVVNETCAAWGIMPIERGHEVGAAGMVADLVESVVMAPGPLAPFGRLLDFSWDVQVLAPMRKGKLGTYALNTELQKLRQRLLGTPPPKPVDPDKPPRPMVGDRIIWTQNDYDLDLMNGTQAIVTRLIKGGAVEIFTEDGREVKIPPAKSGTMEVAYAMTIHKSQGSEWPFVILCAASSHRYMHDRHLLYTGASRASESLTICGDMVGLRRFAQENRSQRRQTFGGFMVHGWSPTFNSGEPLGLPQQVE